MDEYGDRVMQANRIKFPLRVNNYLPWPQPLEYAVCIPSQLVRLPPTYKPKPFWKPSMANKKAMGSIWQEPARYYKQ